MHVFVYKGKDAEKWTPRPPHVLAFENWKQLYPNTNTNTENG